MLAAVQCARDGTDREPTRCGLHSDEAPTGLPGLAGLRHSATVPAVDGATAERQSDAAVPGGAASGRFEDRNRPD